MPKKTKARPRAESRINTAIKKMFGPLTPEERRDLRAVAKRLKRDAERLLGYLAKPRKRVASKRSPKKGT
jgi:hypothetical protein